MIGKIKNIIKNKLIKVISPLINPTIIYGYKRADGVFLPNTRIGNSTHIGNKENFIVHDNVFIAQYSFIDASNGVEIMEGCQIGFYVLIASHSSHISIRLYGKEYRKTKNMEGYTRGSVKIGKYSFVGPHSVIMPNTNIGKGSLVAAYSYVQGDFPDFSIIKGNPAKVIGDTRKLDAPFLEKNPELQNFYNEWAKDEN